MPPCSGSDRFRQSQQLSGHSGYHSGVFWADVRQPPSTLLNLNLLTSFFSAHAALSPWEGRNALDAAVLAYNGISVLRQQLRPEDRVHAIIEGKDWVANSWLFSTPFIRSFTSYPCSHPRLRQGHVRPHPSP